MNRQRLLILWKTANFGIPCLPYDSFQQKFQENTKDVGRASKTVYHVKIDKGIGENG